MVELIRQKLAGLPHAAAEVIDAAAIPGPAEAYDVVVSRMGLMFVPEPLQALQEVRRVLRPGGRLATAVWAAPARNPWMTAVGMAAVMNGVLSGPPPTTPGGPFSLGDPDQLEKLARDAGFIDVRVETAEYTRHYDSAAEQFDMVRVLAPPIAAALSRPPLLSRWRPSGRAPRSSWRRTALTTAATTCRPAHSCCAPLDLRIGTDALTLSHVGAGDVSKRILLGRKLRSAQLGETLLPKRIALPVFASDALSSVAYAPDEVFIMLAIAGASAYVWSWKIATRRRAGDGRGRSRPTGRPSTPTRPAAATTRSPRSTSGQTAGTTVASALLVDYVLTVAVSISSAAQYAAVGCRLPGRPRVHRRGRAGGLPRRR